MKTLLVILFLSSIARARVFDMSETRFGGYFSATYGASSVGKKFFEGESSADSYTKGFDTHMGGEFGFVYNTDHLSWLFGLEIIKPSKIKGIASASGTAVYSYTSDISAYIPKAGVEVVFYQAKTYRIFGQAYFGTGDLTVKTDYSNLTIAPNTDFSIEGKSTANLMNYSLGTEFHWNDNTTIVLAYSYRQLNFRNIKYLADVTNSFTGAASKGDRIMKSDGSPLKYDFTNTYITLGLRFWVQ